MKLSLFAPALLVILTASCTKQQIVQADTVAVDLTNAVCAPLENQPLGQPWVDFVCTGAEVVEGTVAQLEGDAGGAPAPTLKTVIVHVPSADATSFLASHRKK